MKKFSIFQIVVYVLCIIGIIFAILIFSGKISVGKDSKSSVSGTVTMWGTLPSETMGNALALVAGAYPDLHVVYSQKDPATMQSDFVNALASGTGPDLIQLSPADVVKNSDKLLTIPFASLPQNTYLNTFVDESALYLNSTGTVGLPIFIDPMVMYYNRDLLASSFSVSAPKTWDDVVALNKKMTTKDDAGQLSVETVALGTYSNITHAKELLALLAFQTGNSLVKINPATNKYASQFATIDPKTGASIATVFRYYTQFANPSDADHYSWNDSLPLDSTQFIAGRLGLYFGYASELASIRAKNPNLNFAVAAMPQSSKFPTKATYGKMIGVGITKISKNQALGVMVANLMASQTFINSYFIFDTTLAPARKDMLAADQSGDATKALVYNSAIIARGWLDPDPAQTNDLFKRFVTQINAGLILPEGVLSGGNSLIQGILDSFQKDPAPVS
ncbi:MAG: protein of unknown function with transrane region [Patescibacteria group bacterium]|nr:protein of unknown function with transrane region [Patescibacteria group bacterium]